ncbi:Uncharacterised protein [Mycobacterium tuberculosis]|uniref:Uncharacterized protein n=1 Tax=Mycobacterium tuberculosis TaxID=1773 RepID=A0A655ATX5_MYCTX|nr:Uncharacterised protein [Mycobacterium tuberculosis]CKT71686.1 Uncharacterised protein [Mycobacterium tuberculosis]CKT98721.1 Uncharacterised protein [Mycobacterium tuberculosis]
MTTGLQVAHDFNLLLGQQCGSHIGDPGVPSDPPSRSPVVTREQHRWCGGQCSHRRDGLHGIRTKLIGEPEHTDGNSIQQDDGGSGAGRKERRQLC